MLFVLFIIALIVGIICLVRGDDLWDRKDSAWLYIIGLIVTVISVIAVIISGIIIASQHIKTDAMVALNQEKYKALTYQLENNLYDNDNDVGKKELYDEIREWNEDLVYYQTIQDDFWLGIYFPNVFDQFEFIDYDTGG